MSWFTPWLVGLPVVCEELSVVCSSPISESGISRTIGGTLGNGLLATTTADTHAVDDIALLGLVTEAASLVGARGPRGTVDDVQLAELY